MIKFEELKFRQWENGLRFGLLGAAHRSSDKEDVSQPTKIYESLEASSRLPPHTVKYP